MNTLRLLGRDMLSNRPIMIKFIELMNTHNSKERFRFMLFLKMVFKLYVIMFLTIWGCYF